MEVDEIPEKDSKKLITKMFNELREDVRKRGTVAYTYNPTYNQEADAEGFRVQSQPQQKGGTK